MFRLTEDANVTNGRGKLQKPRRWKSILIHQGWFTALYTQHLLASHSFEFKICILQQALNMPLIRCTYVFFQGRLSHHILPPPRRLAPSLGLGTSWVRQPRPGSCHYHTFATKRNGRAKQQKPRRWKSMLIHQGWFTALYTLTRFTQFRV